MTKLSAIILAVLFIAITGCNAHVRYTDGGRSLSFELKDSAVHADYADNRGRVLAIANQER